jgi:hypothetical protein
MNRSKSILLLTTLLLTGCGRSTGELFDMLATVQSKSDSQTFAAGYLFSTLTTIDGQTVGSELLQRVKRTPERLKIEFYADDDRLVQSLVANEDGFFSCDHVQNPEAPLCALMESLEDAQLPPIAQSDFLSAWLKKKSLILKHTRKKAQYGDDMYQGDFFSYELDPGKVSNKHMEDVAGIASGKVKRGDLKKAARDFQERFNAARSSFFYEDDTGILVESVSFVDMKLRYGGQGEPVNIKQEVKYSIQSLERDPSFEEGDFKIHQNARLIVL